jgi:hypothetical protein
LEGIATLRCAKVALAIEQWRNETNGNLPESLSLLVPKFLTEIPPDPFDGSPLRYRRHPIGYSVYSIGSDLKDDSGIGSDRAPKGTNTYDVVFKVER